MGQHDPRINQILHYWFGSGPEADLPDEARTKLWFGQTPETNDYLTHEYKPVLEAGIAGKLTDWKSSPRGQLALIVVFDQFSRNIYPRQPQAYAQDPLALALCEHGIEHEDDQQLSLIERVFYYMPMQHAEDLTVQKQSIIAFRSLVELALPETKTIFQTFYDYAVAHYRIIELFGRYPHRNAILGRESSSEELAYLADMASEFEK